MPNIAAVAASLVLSNRPILLPDSCVLLDPIRAAMRPGELDKCTDAAKKILSLAETPNQSIQIAVASLVAQEWNNNVASVLAELKGRFAEAEKLVSRIIADSALMGVVHSQTEVSLSSHPLPEALFQMSEAILSLAIRLDPLDSANARAIARAASRARPGRAGGEIKDCVIVEECLELARVLRQSGFTKRVVFCTSNTRDYCENRTLAANLASEFKAVQMEFTTSLPWAHSILASDVGD